MKQKMKNHSITKSAFQTKKLAEKLAEEILKSKSGKRAIILALEGDLGGGKTTFIQGFAKGLGIKEKILSPTFVLMKRFKITKIKNQKSKRKVTPNKFLRNYTEQANQNAKRIIFQNFYHIDCYRIKNPKELLDLGFKEIISNAQNIVAIEWSDRVKKIIPKIAIKLKFDFIDKNTRKITIKSLTTIF